MIRRFLQRLARWNAIRGYRENLPRLLVARYGRERRYTPQQVLATIKQHRLSERYAAFACVMFCSKEAYSKFVANHAPSAEVPASPLDDSSIPLWAAAAIADWPAHESVAIDLGSASPWGDNSSDPDGDHAGHHGVDFEGPAHDNSSGPGGSDPGAGGDSSW